MSTPPIAKKVDHRREHHGDVFIDPYEWLRDKNDPEVLALLNAENAYTEEVTAPLEPLRQKIFDEIKARTKETDLSVPTRRGDWWYYARSFEGKQYSVHCRCPISDPDDWTPPQLDGDVEGIHVDVGDDGHGVASVRGVGSGQGIWARTTTSWRWCNAAGNGATSTPTRPPPSPSA